MITLTATYQQTKRLVDAVNSTYQTVLTISSSVSQSDIVGTYNCTVENARGESSETVIVSGKTVSYIEAHTQLWCRKFCRIMRTPKLSMTNLLCSWLGHHRQRHRLFQRSCL